MRFIIEFKVPESHKKLIKDSVIAYNKTIQVQLLGDKIEEAFGWNNLSCDNGVHHTLEIEAFPMADYLAFKSNLINYLTNVGVNPKVIKDRFDILESIGKPVTTNNG